MNYTFLILNLFIYLFVFYKKDTTKLKKCVLISMFIYIFSIYISIITKTYSTTYVEGIGIKGWFESGNSLSSILIIGLFILFTLIKNKQLKVFSIITIAAIGVFLLTLLGTRTALFGFLALVFIYLFVELFILIKNKISINKNVVIFVSIISIVVFCLILILGSSTLQRRQYLKELNSKTIDSSTGQTGHITIDLLDIKTKLDNKQLGNTYISEDAQKSLQSLYEVANKYEIEPTNRRAQQLIYNSYLVIYQANPVSFLFGNGLLNNYAELTMEMELPAFLLNFGLIGFTIYFVPFLIISVYSIYLFFKKFKNIDSEYLILMIGELFTFALACFTGVVFFNSSSMMFIILLNVLLINKMVYLKEGEKV